MMQYNFKKIIRVRNGNDLFEISIPPTKTNKNSRSYIYSIISKRIHSPRMLQTLKKTPKSLSWDHSNLQIPTCGLFNNGVFKTSIFASIRSFTSYTSKKDSYKFNRILTQFQGNIKSINKIHAKIIIRGYGENLFIGSKLFTMYSELGQFYAHKVFDKLPERDVFLWNSKIQSFANLGLSKEALGVYKEMCEQNVVMDKYTFTFVLKASAVSKDEKTGRVIHGHVMKCGFYSNVFVGNALLAFYAKCKMIEGCRKVFNEIPQKDLVSWNTIISGYSTNGGFNEAIELFRVLIRDESIGTPDHATLVSILPACAQEADIRVGFWVHCRAIKTGLENDVMVGNGLIAMYGNCGHLEYARRVFDEIRERNIMVWTAMMRCYGMHGNPEKTLDLFSDFLKNGLRPDGVLFLCLLSTCSHAGLVTKGREIFKQMDDFNIEKGQEHYACMVDLFGRAGLVMEAVELIETMPMAAGKDVYGALLGGCVMHNNIGVAEMVAGKLFEMDPEGGGRYVTLAKIYGGVGRLKEAAAVRKTMVKSGIKKVFGFSMVEVDGVVHRFGAEDESHVRKKEIFETLENVDKIMAKEI